MKRACNAFITISQITPSIKAKEGKTDGTINVSKCATKHLNIGYVLLLLLFKRASEKLAKHSCKLHQVPFEHLPLPPRPLLEG